MDNTPGFSGKAPDGCTPRGGNYWTLITPGTWKVLHADFQQAIQGRCAYAIGQANGATQACGLGVMSGDLLGIFDVGSHANFCRQGLAEALCRKLLAWGHLLGAQQAYIQVTAANTAAVGLYEKLGFRRAYLYWYRVAPPSR